MAEVLVATVLLGIGVSGLVSSAALGLRNHQRVEQRAAALCYAREKLNEVELIGPSTWTISEEDKGAEERNGIQFTWTTSVEELGVGELFEVKVTVNWEGPDRETGTVALATWLNDYEAAAQTTRTERERQEANPTGPSMQPKR